MKTLVDQQPSPEEQIWQRQAREIIIDVSMKLPDATEAYVFRDGNGQQVGTGTALAKSDLLTVTCNGSAPVRCQQRIIVRQLLPPVRAPPQGRIPL